MASTFAKKHTNYLVSYFWFPFIVFFFFLFYVIIVIFLSLLSIWVEPYVFPLLRKHFTYKTNQCKFYLIVPEEGWFGQPKYSTPSKNFTYVVSVFASIFLFFFLIEEHSLVLELPQRRIFRHWLLNRITGMEINFFEEERNVADEIGCSGRAALCLGTAL